MKQAGAIRALLLIAVGSALSVYSLLAMQSFIRTARPVIMMGSNIQPGGAMVQSTAVIIFLIALFAAGAVLILYSVKKLIRSLKK